MQLPKSRGSMWKQRLKVLFTYISRTAWSTTKWLAPNQNRKIFHRKRFFTWYRWVQSSEIINRKEINAVGARDGVHAAGSGGRDGETRTVRSAVGWRGESRGKRSARQAEIFFDSAATSGKFLKSLEWLIREKEFFF